MNRVIFEALDRWTSDLEKVLRCAGVPVEEIVIEGPNLTGDKRSVNLSVVVAIDNKLGG